MCDASDVLRGIDALQAPFEFEDDDRSRDIPRPTTPVPTRTRTLRRTTTLASINTIRLQDPPKKGIRRPIEEIAENLKHKFTKKKKKSSSTKDDITKQTTEDVASDSKASPKNEAAKHKRKAASPLRTTSHKSGENVLKTIDRFDSVVPIDLDVQPDFPCFTPESLLNEPLFTEDDPVWAKSSGPGPWYLASRSEDVKINDVQLHIWSSKTDLTIWDGLRAPHHIFKCRLFLRCTTHPYDSVSLQGIRKVEMDCNTRLTGSHYIRLPVLQATYKGAVPGHITESGDLLDVNLADGIYMDRLWCKIRNDDGTWGWYRDAFIPLSPRLFDKMDYREFKLVSRVWIGESCVEDELTFGISMLLRGIDMK